MHARGKSFSDYQTSPLCCPKDWFPSHLLKGPQPNTAGTDLQAVPEKLHILSPDKCVGLSLALPPWCHRTVPQMSSYLRLSQRPLLNVYQCSHKHMNIEHTYSPRPTLSSTTNKEKQVEPHLPGSPTRFQVRGEAMGTDWAIWIWQVLAPSISTWSINKIVLFFSKNLVMVPPPLDSSVAHSARHECPSAQRPSSSGSLECSLGSVSLDFSQM